MKILIIGGTGTISSAVTQQLAESGHDVWLLNRGNRSSEVPQGVKQIVCDINSQFSARAQLACYQRDARTLNSQLSTLTEPFDAVCQFIAFLPSQVERDIRLFRGRTRQYVFISSASAYCKPAPSHVITEGTTLANPHWQYSRDKIACEQLLIEAWREQQFPVTIVRPSHTYCERGVPTSVHGPKGSWPVLKRMLEGKPVIIQGDGTSLWTLTWNEDFARGFIGLLGNPRAIGEAFQIMSDEQLTWTQVYQCVAQALGVELKPYYVASDFLAAVAPREWDFEGNLLGDKSCTVIFDCSKLKRVVPGFQCTTRFDEGVRRCVAYLLAHPELQVEEPAFDQWCDRVIAAQEQARQSLAES